MNIFGQVWLWSLLSFVAGALLTWVVMVRPARKQAADLEDQLRDARRAAPPVAAAPAADEFVVDEWADAPPRSLSDEVLAPAPPPPAPAPAPYAEPPAYRGEPVPAPVPAPVVEDPVDVDEVEEPSAPVRQYLQPDEAQRRFEEQLAGQRTFTEDDDDRPRSLFERLAPENEAPAETPAEMTAVLPRSGPQAADYDDEPELPAEQTSYVPTVEPVAEPAPPVEKPTAGPEVHEPADDFIYQPREVWAEEEQESFLDEAAETEDEPAGTRSEQTTYIAVDEGTWPDNDLTGEFPGLRDEISGQLDGFTEPEASAEQTGLIEPVDLDAPHVRNGVFETTLAEERAFTEPEPAREEPARDEPVYEEPARDEPAHEEPAREEPAYERPAREEPAYERPAREEPAYEEPAREEPAHEEPVLAEFVEPRPSFSQPFTAPGAPPPAPFSAFSPRTEAEEVPERTPRAVGAAFSHGTETPAPAPAPVADRPRSLFEPLLDADEPLPPTGQTRTLPDTRDDQPFVPKFVPSDEPLLAAPPEPEPEPVVESDLPQRVTEAGLPIREARRTTVQRQQSFPAFQAFESPKQETPPPPAALPARPRPVGYSPSTGGRPNGAPGSSARFQQPEGFNPRSPFGPGSVLPKSDGLAPAPDFAVKATLTGRRYYNEGSANFAETRADVWFRTEADAEKAGFRPAP
ncbi:hypothetical protein SAMN05216188_101703 [Lentzea xinjiangensis]|uniref:Uncharacterized protein n=1 Tax=Lentzea xinjiangensis TaxID=402600 RepID=A0A1H9B9P4_9PSEU|nr:hypothetical protein [Lentzea xinjiangensis]SEP85684.1 hypothetical protein SAMN05216188_101703 [Lentzea xinjiangensis]